MTLFDGNSCSHSCSDRIRKPAAYVDPKYLLEQQQKAAAREAWTGLGISIFLGLTSSVIQGIGSGKISFGSSSGVEVEDRTVEEIEADIKNILKEFECETISDAEASLENDKLALKKAKEDTEICTNCIKYCDTKIKELQNANEDLQTRINELNSNTNLNKSEIQQQIQSLKAKIEYNKDKINEHEELKKSYQEKLNNAKDIIEKYPAQIEKKESYIKNLHKLERELKKSKEEDAKTSLSNYQNEDTENITEIIKKLRKTRNSNSERSQNLDTDAEKAIFKYYDNHKVGDNKTIDNLAKTLGFKLENLPH